MVLWDGDREGEKCQNTVEVKLVCPGLATCNTRSRSELVHPSLEVLSAHHFLGHWQVRHAQISHIQTCSQAQMDLILCSLLLFLCLSAQVGKWAAVHIKTAAVSQKMLTKTNQPKACVARRQSASYYALLPFVCIHSSDFVINILCLRPSKKFPLQAGTESSPLRVPRWFNLTSDCWCEWLQLLHFSLTENWQNSHVQLCAWAYASRDSWALQDIAVPTAFWFSSLSWRFFPFSNAVASYVVKELTCLLVTVQPYPEGNPGKKKILLKLFFLGQATLIEVPLTCVFVSVLGSSIDLLYLNLSQCS